MNPQTLSVYKITPLEAAVVLPISFLEGKFRSTSLKPCATAFIDEEYVSAFFGNK